MTCINLIAKVPTVVAYNYKVSRYRQGGSLRIIPPDPELSMAENFLYMLRGSRPNREEAMLFDLSLMLHAEHGGGNNSTFTVRTVSSSGANTYMAICSGIASLSGHLHGGANEAVMMMMKDIKKHVKNWEDRNQVKKYLVKILDGKAHDRTGKIYGIGHAVYTVSDPRAEILLEKAEELSAQKKELQSELELMKLVAEVASELIFERKGRVVAPNVDFYSGFIYKMLHIPIDLFTPIFAMSRVAGWSAHRIEQIIQSKLIRPAYVSSLPKEFGYVPLEKRK
jgi:citrate synthase